MQNRGVDLIVYDDKDQAVLLVEVKGRVGTSEQWAAQYRRNLLSHGTLPQAPYFLIATADRLYFWKQNHSGNSEELPTFTMNAAEEFKPYLEGHKQSLNEIGEEALVYILVSWLNDLQQTIVQKLKQEPALYWLVESGLIDSLAEGHLQMAVA